MNLIWLIVMVLSILMGLINGQYAGMSEAVLSSCGDAIRLCLSLAGAYALWCGLLAILEDAGLMRALARRMRPLMGLFPGVRGKEDVEDAVATNLAANMLGLGNAATPAGIRAIRGMKDISPDGERASDAMCMFLVVNASSLQLLPTTVVSLRAAAGAAQPFDIVMPTLLATLCSLVAAVAMMKAVLWGGRRLGDAFAGGGSPSRAGRVAGGKLPGSRRL